MTDTKHIIHESGIATFRYADPLNKKPFEVSIRCPLPNRSHPEQAAILEQHRTWARSFGIPADEEGYQRYCNTRFDLLAAYQCHDLPLAAAVLHSHLMTWFFVFDDIMDIDHRLDEEVRPLVFELFNRHISMLDGGSPDAGDPRCIHAFHDLLAKVREAAAGSPWYERMVHHLREYVTGAHWESMIGPTTDRNANTPFYLQVRYMAVGVAPCLDLMALGAGLDPKPLVHSFFIQRLERLAINYSIWVNDLAGLNRDMARGLGNVVFTLKRDHGLSLQDAAAMLGRMCDAELEAFLMLEKQLPALIGSLYEGHRNAFDGYGKVMKNWMRGLLDWSVRTDRYRRTDQDMALQNRTQIRKTLGKKHPKRD